MRIRCRLGIHEWEYGQILHHGLPWGGRKCKQCGKPQFRTTLHWLDGRYNFINKKENTNPTSQDFDKPKN